MIYKRYPSILSKHTLYVYIVLCNVDIEFVIMIENYCFFKAH